MFGAMQKKLQEATVSAEQLAVQIAALQKQLDEREEENAQLKDEVAALKSERAENRQTVETVETCIRLFSLVFVICLCVRGASYWRHKRFKARMRTVNKRLNDDSTMLRQKNEHLTKDNTVLRQENERVTKDNKRYEDENSTLRQISEQLTTANKKNELLTKDNTMLRQENERVTEDNNTKNALLTKDNTLLRQENERLTKDGDKRFQDYEHLKQKISSLEERIQKESRLTWPESWFAVETFLHRAIDLLCMLIGSMVILVIVIVVVGSLLIGVACGKSSDRRSDHPAFPRSREGPKTYF